MSPPDCVHIYCVLPSTFLESRPIRTIKYECYTGNCSCKIWSQVLYIHRLATQWKCMYKYSDCQYNKHGYQELDHYLHQQVVSIKCIKVAD